MGSPDAYRNRGRRCRGLRQSMASTPTSCASGSTSKRRGRSVSRPPSSVIEVVIGKVCVRLRGEVDAQRLASVLEAVADTRDRPALRTRVWIAAGHTDMRKGFNGLAALEQRALADKPVLGPRLRLPRPPRRQPQGALVRRARPAAGRTSNAAAMSGRRQRRAACRRRRRSCRCCWSASTGALRGASGSPRW